MAKKWGILVKKESGSLAFTDLEIPRDYNIAVEESAKGIAGVSESSVQLSGNVNDIQSEASDNNGVAENLATEVGRFKLE